MEKLELIKKIETDLLIYTDPQIVERLTYLKNKLNENPPTKEEYFTIKNRYLSNSRIGDWLKDKEYFKKRHITGEIESKKSDEFLIGSATDEWLTNSRKSFESKYICVSRRSLKNPPANIIELNNSQYSEVVEICESVERQDAYKELKDHQKQQILSMTMDLGTYWVGLAGIPDYFKVDGKNGIITDLKTVEQAKNAVKYHYRCLDYRYYSQAAVYSILLKHNFKEVENIVCRHISVEKDQNHIHHVYTFILDAERIEMEKENILTNILPEIAKEKLFLPSNTSWKEARTIGGIDNEI